MKNKASAVNLILCDARGIYIPRDFVTSNYGEIAEEHCHAWRLTEETKEHWVDCANPESEFYWDAWDWVLNNAQYTDEDGNEYVLHHDGDLWALCFDRMTEEDKRNFGFEIEE